jgi:hypothetical protein
MIKKKEASKLWEIHPEGNETPLKQTSSSLPAI